MGDYTRDLQRSEYVDAAKKAAEIEAAYAERQAQLRSHEPDVAWSAGAPEQAATDGMAR